MPFKSRSQVRRFWAAEAAGELPEGTAHRWAQHTPSIKALPDKVGKAKKQEKKPPEKQAAVAAISQILRTVPVTGNEKNALSARSRFAKTALQMALQNPVYTAPYTAENAETGFAKAGESRPDPSILTDDLNTHTADVPTKESYEALMGKEVRANHIARTLLRQSLDNYTEAQRKTANATLNSVYPQTSGQILMGSAVPHQAGSGLVPTGLDAQNANDSRPMQSSGQVPPRQDLMTRGKATAVPGMQGVAAANPIDMHGPLDPRGLALDGNHAAGVPKGFKIATWLQSRYKQAAKPFGTDGKPITNPREDCAHCGTMHERSEEGYCNSCGRDFDTGKVPERGLYHEKHSLARLRSRSALTSAKPGIPTNPAAAMQSPAARIQAKASPYYQRALERRLNQNGANRLQTRLSRIQKPTRPPIGLQTGPATGIRTVQPVTPAATGPRRIRGPVREKVGKFWPRVGTAVRRYSVPAAAATVAGSTGYTAYNANRKMNNLHEPAQDVVNRFRETATQLSNKVNEVYPKITTTIDQSNQALRNINIASQGLPAAVQQGVSDIKEVGNTVKSMSNAAAERALEDAEVNNGVRDRVIKVVDDVQGVVANPGWRWLPWMVGGGAALGGAGLLINALRRRRKDPRDKTASAGDMLYAMAVKTITQKR